MIGTTLLVVLGVGLGAGWFLRPVTAPGMLPTYQSAGAPAADESVAVLPFGRCANTRVPRADVAPLTVRR